ncbi:MAG: Fosfomycin resistance protein AbaF [Holosporales bacterium]
MIVYFGTFLEFFEFVLFATLFPVFSNVFKNHFNVDQQATLQFFLLWVGFLSRPLGALFLAPMGDLYNRKTVLITSVVGMSLTTMVMGCIPISVDPYILITFVVVLRLFQGFFTGVEYSSSTIYVFESLKKQDDQKLSVIYMGMMATLGAACAYFVAALCQLELVAFINFWRAIFLLTGFFGLWVGGLRLMRLPKDFMNINPSQLEQGILNQKKKVFKKSVAAFFIVGLSYAPFYYITSFLNIYSVVLNQSDPFFNFLINAAICLFIVFILYLIAMRYKKIFFKEHFVSYYFLIFMVSLWPLSYLIFNCQNMVVILSSQMMLIIFSQLVVSNTIGCVPYFFDQHIRVRSYTLVQTLAASLLGGAAPLICHFLATFFADKSFAAFYPLVLTGVAFFFFKRKGSYTN